MADYRLYPMKQNHVDGPPAVLAAATDAEAVEKAVQLMNGNSVATELWERARCVAKLPSTKTA